jgi:hypothetical protein
MNDQTNAGLAPGSTATLFDVDKADLLMGAATNIIVATMPLITERNKLVITLAALGTNDAFHYSRYVLIIVPAASAVAISTSMLRPYAASSFAGRRPMRNSAALISIGIPTRRALIIP